MANNKSKSADAADKKKTAKDVKQSKAVTTTSKPGAIMTQSVPMGLENPDRDLLVVPRLKLVQKVSVEVDDGIPAGTLVNSITKEVYAKPGQTLEVIPLMMSRSRIYFIPFSEKSDRMFYCRSFDGREGIGEPGGTCSRCPHSQWGEDGTPPVCTDYINIAVIPIVNKQPMNIPAVLSFGRTSYGTGKQLYNLIYFKRTSPWYFKYNIYTKAEQNDMGTFFVLKQQPAGTSPEDLIEMLEQSYDMLQGKNVQVHEDFDEMKEERDKMGETGSDEEDDMPF